MIWSILNAVFTMCAFMAIAVFVAALKFTLRESNRDRVHPFEPVMPRATIYGRKSHGRKSQLTRWHKGAGKQKLLDLFRLLHAVFIAVGITSLFVMFLSMVGVIAVLVFATW